VCSSRTPFGKPAGTTPAGILFVIQDRQNAFKPILTAGGAESCFPGRQEGAAGAVKAAMSNDLVVPPVAVAVSATESTGQAKVAAATVAMEPKQTVTSSVGPNPSLQLDPALGLVVIEFRNDAGAVTTSIPSERQIQAYQRWAATHIGPAPRGMPASGISTATSQHPRAESAPAKRAARTEASPQTQVVTNHKPR